MRIDELSLTILARAAILTGLLLAGCAGETASLPAGMSKEQLQPLAVDEPLLAAMQSELERYLLLEKSAASPAAADDPAWPLELHGAMLRWQAQLDGDYNQDGEVGLADLVPLSRHLGERAPFKAGSIQELLDGDANGEVNIADLQLIARNFGRRISGYAVYGSSAGRDYPLSGAAAGSAALLLGVLATQDGSGSGRRQYEWQLDRQPGWTYWVTALDSDTQLSSSRPLGIDNWRMFGGNPQHSGSSPFCVAQPVVLSRLAADGQDEGMQFISTPDGLIYRAGSYASVSAFSLQDDTELWHVDVPNEVGGLAATADGGLIVGSGYRVIRYTAAGELVWSFDAGDWISCPPVIRSDGAIICADAQQRLLCLDPEGGLLWSHLLDNTLEHSPAIAEDGTIYCDNGQNVLLAFSAPGELLWELQLEESIDSSPGVAADGTVYVVLFYGDLASVSPSGKLNWQAEARRGGNAYPVLRADGSILTTSYDRVNCFSPAGKLLWNYRPTGTVNGGLLTDSAGYAYFGSKDGNFFCLDSSGGLAWQLQGLAGKWSTPLIDGRGSLHLINEGYYLQLGPPAVPQGLNASTGQPDRIELAWQAQFGTEGFELQYRPAGNPAALWQDLAVLQSGERSLYRHVPESPAPGQPGYDYRVRAVYNGNIRSDWSEPVNGRLASGEAPVLGWPVQGGNPQRTGLSNVSGPADAKLQWKFQCGAAIQGSAVVTADGQVCFGSDNRTMFMLDPDGKQRWLFETQGPITSSPAIRDDGHVCVGSTDGGVYCVKPDGTLDWNYQADRSFGAAPVFGPDGRLHICDMDGQLISLDRQGNLLFLAPAGVGQLCSPAVSQGGDVFTGNLQIFSSGRIGYRPVIGSSLSSPMLGPDGMVFLTTLEGTISAIDVQGFVSWSWGLDYPLYLELKNTPALGPDGMLYVAVVRQGIHILNDEGTLQYLVGAGAQEEFIGITLDADGRIYAGSREGFIRCYDSGGSQLWSYETGGPLTGAPAIGPDGTLYIGSADGYLYAFGD